MDPSPDGTTAYSRRAFIGAVGGTAALSSGVVGDAAPGAGPPVVRAQSEEGETQYDQPTFEATGQGGFISFDWEDEETARDNGFDFPETGLDDTAFEFSATVDEEAGTWESIETNFPIVSVTSNYALAIEASDGLSGTLTTDGASMTISGDLTVTFLDASTLDPLPDTDPITFGVDLTTGSSGGLSGSADIGEETGEVTLVDNELTVDDRTGNSLVDRLIGLPSQEPGSIWLELQFTLSGLEDISIAGPGDGGDGGGFGATALAALGGVGALLALLGGYVIFLRDSDEDDAEQGPSPQPGAGQAGPGGGGTPQQDWSTEQATGAGTDQPGAGTGQTVSEDRSPQPQSGGYAQQRSPASADTGAAEPGGEPTATQSTDPDAAANEDTRPMRIDDAAAGPAGAAGAAGAGAATGGDGPIDEEIETIEAHVARARDARGEHDYDDALQWCAAAIDLGETVRQRTETEAPGRTDAVDDLLAETRALQDGIEDEADVYDEAWDRIETVAERVEALAGESDQAAVDDLSAAVADVTDELDAIERLVAGFEFQSLSSRLADLRTTVAEMQDEDSDRSAYQVATANLEEIEATLDEVAAELDAENLAEAEDLLADVEALLDDTGDLVEGYQTPGIDSRIADRRSRWQDLTAEVEDLLNTGVPETIPAVGTFDVEYADIERVETIGAGQNAEVYRATVTRNGEDVVIAVKEPHLDGAFVDDGDDEDGAVEGDTTDSDGGSGSTRIWYDGETAEFEAAPTDFQGIETEPTAADSETLIPGEADDGPGGQGDGDAEAAVADNPLLQAAATWRDLAEHDHVVDVVDFGIDERPWIAMEYMDEGHVGYRAGEMSLAEGLWTAVAVADALTVAHDRDITHLDFKPENVLLRSTERGWDVPKVADWEVSSLLLNHPQSEASAAIHYAAPEQLDEEYGPPDERTDVYQFGTVLYELFTGEKAFSGHPAAVMNQILDNDVDPPSAVADVPEKLDEILLRAMALEKSERYQAVGELREDLAAVQDSLT